MCAGIQPCTKYPKKVTPQQHLGLPNKAQMREGGRERGGCGARVVVVAAVMGSDVVDGGCSGGDDDDDDGDDDDDDDDDDASAVVSTSVLPF